MRGFVKLKASVTELNHHQGELMSEESCGEILMYMDADDYKYFKANHEGMAIRLNLRVIK